MAIRSGINRPSHGARGAWPDIKDRGAGAACAIKDALSLASPPHGGLLAIAYVPIHRPIAHLMAVIVAPGAPRADAPVLSQYSLGRKITSF